MPDTNGSSRIDRIETQLATMGEILQGLIEHAESTDRRFDQVHKSIVELRLSQAEINTAVKNLTGALRDLIDRIPPENLR